MTASRLPALVVGLGSPANETMRDLSLQLQQAGVASMGGDALFSIVLQDVSNGARQPEDVGRVRRVDGVNVATVPAGNPRALLTAEVRLLMPGFDVDYNVVTGALGTLTDNFSAGLFIHISYHSRNR